MKIVVLDGYALNPGDLSWEGAKKLGDCEIYERTPADKVLERLEGAQAVLTNKVVLNREIIQALPDLKYIGVTATGYNIVDIDAAKEHGITVTNIPIYGTMSVAQMTFALILNLTQHVMEHHSAVQDGKWLTAKDWCFWDFPLIELQGLTLGLIGFGRIGSAVTNIALAMGMNVVFYDIFKNQQVPEGVKYVELDEVFKQSDFVSLHCPLTKENHQLINADKLNLMKNSAFLINTSRGPLVDEQALADALNQGKIAGAGLDVLAVEPPDSNNPLLSAKNCYVTPHIAWATKSARNRLLTTAVNNLKAYINGNPENIVS